MKYEFRKVYKHFNNEVILNNISFSIKAGSIVGLIGRNGSGKSTTLNLMANLLLPDKGETYFKQNIIKSDDNYLLDNISIFLDPERSLYWRLTGLENLERIIKLKDLDYQEERTKIDCLLQKLNMYEAKDKYVKDYSKGMKTKILLISCFIVDPSALLLDEPFAGLDYESQNEIMNLFKTYTKDGGTIIITEHNMIALENICDELYWFEKGNIILKGSKEELLKTISGEGVLKVFCKNREAFKNGIDNLNLNINKIKEEEN